jgi:nitroimidazol reductase NimA-like FMN-containing flavoprotein (pyridoxamine 5'-phosphate oxidase superfamily)
MRRRDREIVDPERIWEILRSSEVCRVAFCSEDWPYIVPMNFGILDEKLYFHCASAGTKLDLLTANPNVCFEAEANVEIRPGDRACSWSVCYRSVIGFGRASVVEDLEERRAGLNALLAQYASGELAQYTVGDIEVPQQISPDMLILRVDIYSLKGKESTGQ